MSLEPADKNVCATVNGFPAGASKNFPSIILAGAVWRQTTGRQQRHMDSDKTLKIALTGLVLTLVIACLFRPSSDRRRNQSDVPRDSAIQPFLSGLSEGIAVAGLIDGFFGAASISLAAEFTLGR